MLVDRRREAGRRSFHGPCLRRRVCAPSPTRSTVNPYLGTDSVEPFLEHDGLGVLVVLRTSNPGSADIQDLPLADGRLTVGSTSPSWSSR